MLPIKNILHPSDFSTSAQAALTIAAALARDYRATLTLLHVRPVNVAPIGEFGALPPEPRDTDAVVIEKLRQLVPASFAGKVECLVRDGDAADEILNAAGQARCDVIVIGSHGRAGLSRLLVGSVAEAVLRRASCPVLTIKLAPVRSASEKEGRSEKGEDQPREAPDELATVYSVTNPVEAEVIRTALKREGIQCVLEGARQGGIAGVTAFPIKIQVRPDDVPRARRFIQHHETHRR